MTKKIQEKLIETPTPKDKKQGSAPSLVVLLLLVFAFKSSFLDANNIPSGSMIPTLKIGDFLFVNKMRYSFRMPFTESELIRFDNPKRGDIVTFAPPPAAVPQEYADRSLLSGIGKAIMPSLFSKRFVKRIVGMPGDRIKFTQKKLTDSTGKEVTYFFIEYMDKNSNSFQSYSPQAVDPENELKDMDNRNAIGKSLFIEEKPGFKHFVIEGIHRGRYKFLNDFCDRDNFDYPMPVEYHEGSQKFLATYCASPSRMGVIPEGYYMMMGDNREDSSDSRYWGLVKREDILGKAMIIYLSINWKDSECSSFIETSHPDVDITIKEMEKKTDASLCHPDELASYEYQPKRGLFSSLWLWSEKLVLYKIPRMEIRWKRIGNVLK
jgi:signal peptidase I